MMEAFLTSNEWPWRLARTVVQGVLGVVVANVDMLVGCAVLEISGQVNVFPVSQKRPVTPEDLRVRTSYENLPLHLILDGKLQKESLKNAHLTTAWLAQQLSRFPCAIDEAYYCALDTDGVLCVQKKQESRVRFARALDPKEVCW